jgi:hypothetical protein
MSSDHARYAPTATLPVERAFVVHFRGAGRGRRRFAGRVEHLDSGAFTHFVSLRGLLAFFAKLLDAPPRTS